MSSERVSGRPDGYYESGLWLYADEASYAPGETATFFVSSPAPEVRCRIARLGAEETPVHEQAGIRAGHQEVPAHAYRDGCGWPENFGGDVARAMRGHATFGSFRRGRGEVFTAATTEWAWALDDPFVDRITRNVLARAESGR